MAAYALPWRRTLTAGWLTGSMISRPSRSARHPTCSCPRLTRSRTPKLDVSKNMVVTAVSQATGETFVVRAAELYPAVVELAVQVGIEVEDG